MKYTRRWLVLLPMFLLVTFARSAVAGPETYPQYVMAGVLAKFSHSATHSEKAKLKSLIDDARTSAHERILARVLMNVEDTVTVDDRAKLEELLSSKKTSVGVKTLAMMITNLNHRLAEHDKEKLLRFGILPPK